MFQSAITCKQFEDFVKLCKESKEEALKVCCQYTNTDQDLLREVIEAIHHGGKFPQTPFTHSECEVQNKIMKGYYDEILRDPSK